MRRSREPEQRDQGLRVPAFGHRAGDVGARPADDLDALVLLGLGRLFAVAESGGQVQPDALVGEPGAGVEAEELPPVRGPLAYLLGELSSGRRLRRLALDV